MLSRNRLDQVFQPAAVEPAFAEQASPLAGGAEEALGGVALPSYLARPDTLGLGDGASKMNLGGVSHDSTGVPFDPYTPSADVFPYAKSKGGGGSGGDGEQNGESSRRTSKRPDGTEVQHGDWADNPLNFRPGGSQRVTPITTAKQEGGAL